MPGERVEDAIDAAVRLTPLRINTILTRLGENLSDLGEAEEVCRHYLDVLDLVGRAGIDAQISVKPTQLGYDQDVEVCHRLLATLLEAASAAGTLLWLDMESSAYVDGTIALYRRLRQQSPRVGVALQAYLRRTERDLEALVPLGAAIRLVKGAYLEPAAVAFPRKADVDENYFRLASRLLQADRLPAGSVVHLATHDGSLQERLRALIAVNRIPAVRYEFAMLYGIRPTRQAELARAGVPVRCLISYGDRWFAWYMRRLAERPANVWFVVKNAIEFI